MKKLKLLTKKQLSLYDELHDLFDGGLSVVKFDTIPDYALHEQLKKFGDNIFTNTHLHGYIHYNIDSRIMKKIIDITEKHKAFFIVEPVMKSKYASSGFWFSILPKEK